MSLTFVGIIGIIILLLVLFFLGIPVGFAMGIVGFCGFWYVVSFKAAVSMVGTGVWTIFSKYGLTVVPLFIFLGYLAFNSGIAERLYNVAYKWFGHWRGGLAIATIGADELFAAICGSNTATAATMGAVALPQMAKYKYDTRLSTGTITSEDVFETISVSLEGRPEFTGLTTAVTFRYYAWGTTGVGTQRLDNIRVQQVQTTAPDGERVQGLNQ